jgi:hypothetical protein
LSAAFDVGSFGRRIIKTNTKVKSGGQECPPYTRVAPSPTTTAQHLND